MSCSLGDACGYVWGRVNERTTISMTNTRLRQTYFGAIEPRLGQVSLAPAQCGNGKETVAFLQSLRKNYEGKRLVIVWDDASYHKGQEVRSYLAEVNANLAPEEWLITCIGFAPNAPEQNPMEDIWQKGKQGIRRNWCQCTTFARVKEIFGKTLQNTCHNFAKLYKYTPFLEIT